MEIFLAIVLGLVQGISEFLPISSSGHLILVSWFLSGKPLPLSLNVALHVGTLLSIVIYFQSDWLRLIKHLFLRIFRKQRSFESDVMFPCLLISAIPVSIVGLLAKDAIERLFHHPASLVWPLMFIGIALWLVDRNCRQNRSLLDLSLLDALFIGLMQTLALIPGVSRSGITMLAGRALGFNRQDAARFSFLMGALPMAGATLVELKAISASIMDPLFYVGIISSCVFGCLAVGLLLRFLPRFGFGIFAVYRLGLGLTILYLLA